MASIIALTACNSTDNKTNESANVTTEESIQKQDTAQTGNDANWAAEVADGGMLEVKLGELAQTNASAAGVKGFGAMMVKDHGAANAALSDLSRKLNIRLPTALSEKSQKMYDDMAGMKGKDFDKAYTMGMVTDHEKDIQKFQEEADNGSNADLKAFASKTLPVLNRHLNVVKGLSAKMK